MDFIDNKTVKGEIAGIKIDCIAHKSWLNSPININGIRFVRFEDLAAMKLNAIVGNGSRIKDYIDLAYLSSKITLNEMLNAYQTKYSSYAVMGLKAIAYFDEINLKEPISLFEKKVLFGKKSKNTSYS